MLHKYPFGKGGTWDRPARSTASTTSTSTTGTTGGEEEKGGGVKQEAHSPVVMNGNMTNGVSSDRT